MTSISIQLLLKEERSYQKQGLSLSKRHVDSLPPIYVLTNVGLTRFKLYMLTSIPAQNASHSRRFFMILTSIPWRQAGHSNDESP